MKEPCRQSWISRILGRFFRSECAGCTGCGGKTCGNVGDEVTLDSLAIGQQGEVVEVAGGNQDMVNRFADHGLVRGIKVSVHEQALFGGPMLVHVQGTMMALRRREAQLIRVKILSV